jgi:hypothetical protein
MPVGDREAARVRFVKRLCVVADEEQPDFIRLAAVRAIKATLPTAHPYQVVTAHDLLHSVKPSWESRTYMEGGRGVERRVRRPPETLADLW